MNTEIREVLGYVCVFVNNKRVLSFCKEADKHSHKKAVEVCNDIRSLFEIGLRLLEYPDLFKLLIKIMLGEDDDASRK